VCQSEPQGWAGLASGYGLPFPLDGVVGELGLGDTG